MKRRKLNTRALSAAGITGASYAVLTLLLAPISYGAIQFRVSEVLCILPFFLPQTAPGLFVGCLAANLFTGNIFDIVFGSLATLAASLFTVRFGVLGRTRPSLEPAMKILSCFTVALVNALVVGAVITRAYNGIAIADHPGVYAMNALQVGLGEAAVMFALGLPLMLYLPKKKFFTEFIIKVNNG